jgi:hypothetical protein
LYFLNKISFLQHCLNLLLELNGAILEKLANTANIISINEVYLVFLQASGDVATYHI